MTKPLHVADIKEVIYSQEHWKLFNELRKKALKMMIPLVKAGFNPIVHGSLARGDVNKHSDVDIFVPRAIPSYKVELVIDEAGFEILKREIVMATPWQLPKAHIYIEENQSITFPLLEPKPLELEFYHFGGAVGLEHIKKDMRVPGIDKRLMLIDPTPRGHVESPVIKREAEAAKRVGVSLDIVRERVQVLTRRAEIGHSGIFIKRELAPEESFESVLRKLIKKNPAVGLRFKRK
ncbi:MAG: DNA polymerase subunit beta [Hadesarchaea archaeon]|nr:MAG: DNA polymerase subunit beta [Hadesarchaea archaeon]